MYESAIEVLNVLWGYFPIIAATLFIYIVESRASLKIWQALQECTFPEPEDESPENVSVSAYNRILRFHRKSLVFIILAIFLIAAAAGGGIVIDLKAKEWYDIYCFTVFLIPTVFCVTRMFNLLSGRTVRSVSRGTDGKPIIMFVRSQEIGMAMNLLLHFCAILFSVIALWFRHMASLAIVFAAYLDFVLSSERYMRVSMKLIMMSSLFMMMHGSMLIWLATTKSIELPIQFFPMQDNTHSNIPILILSSFWLAMPFASFSVLYRFDYINAQQSITLPSELSPQPGHAVLFSRGQKFSKPYFHTAIMAFLCSVIIVTILSVNGYIRATIDSLAVCTMSLAPSIAALLASSVALVRGEQRKLWSYVEEWKIKRPEYAAKGTMKPTIEDEKEILIDKEGEILLPLSIKVDIV